MCEWKNASLNKWTNVNYGIKKCMNKWVSEWTTEWVNERLNEWMNDWMSEWTTEWVHEWMMPLPGRYNFVVDCYVQMSLSFLWRYSVIKTDASPIITKQITHIDKNTKN